MNSQLVRRVLLTVAIIVVVAAAAIPGFHYYRYIESHVSTDDAYVDGTVALVSSRVAGTVTNVYVEDNWTVKEGQLLLTLDPRDFDVRVEQAQAQLERARQSVDGLYALVEAARSGVSLTVSQRKQAQIDFDRAKSLKEQGVVSIQQYDQANTGLRVAIADEALAEHQLTQAEAALGSPSDDHSRYARPVVRQAEAVLEAAKLDLDYTRLTAPFQGIVTHKTAHVGNRVQVGEPLLAIVPLGKLYLTANFKETQLTDVRVGQKAEHVDDIYHDYTYKGHVDSISMGTGAAFSILPAEIVIEGSEPQNKPLRLGLSVEVTIDLSDRSGPLLSSIVQQRYQKDGQTLPNETLEMAPRPPSPAEPPPHTGTQQHFMPRVK